ncbi:hypothetical protein [Kaistella jeonii]|uniref:Uncharacterized protein n=1 Tax=Kaistella jeonii TaxID=266749 RepID=A0A0C1F658_9FLAO|nr:hypothetical protein [Kaistella jeonii]KIA88647.1 hypothetical protein OA86_09720 [Kaistella jeonii]SFC09200.1 hypothetical protein SAMN05421876_10684 [Kaistella jeonii]VEI95210.1 Uncharacterised protein [Kaistella jeonii]
MEIIQIKASSFFELLKMKDTSMWEIFAQMLGEKEKEIVFLDDEEKILFNYILPNNLAQLNGDREKFSKEYSDKLSGLN